MVMFSNGILSVENAKKRPLENGDRSSCGHSLKWKARNVSAIRDFPPGCGPNALTPVNLVPQEDGPALVVAENLAEPIGRDGVRTSENDILSAAHENVNYLAADMVENVSAVVQSAKGSDINTFENDLVEQGMVSVNEEVNEAEVKALVDQIVHDVAVGTEKLSTLEVKGLTVVTGQGVDIKPLPRAVAQRRVSAKRDYPPFCGLNAPEPTDEDRIRITGRNIPVAAKMDLVGRGRSTDVMVVNDEETLGNVRDGAANPIEPTNRSESVGLVEAMILKTEPLKGNVRDLAVLNNERGLIGTEPKDKFVNTTQEGDKDIREKVRSHNDVYSRDRFLKRKPSDDVISHNIKSEETSEDIEPSKIITSVDVDSVKLKMEDRVVVHCVMAAANCPWRQGKDGATLTRRVDVTRKSEVKKSDVATPKKAKDIKAAYVGRSAKPKSRLAAEAADIDLALRKKENEHDEDESMEAFPAAQGPVDLDVTLPPFGPRSSSDARNKVRETLRLYQAIYRKLLQGEEAKSCKEKKIKRIDLVAMSIIKNRNMEVNKKKIFGHAPGVEVGDEFHFRAELHVVGVHGPLQGGIDYITLGGLKLACSIVASGGYDDDLDNPDCLIYSGSGGVGKDKQPENQKLERGNLALKNSISKKYPVRVIRGSKEVNASDSSSRKGKVELTYIYDGLYTVERYWQDPTEHGNLLYKFELKRIPGQPELSWKEVKRSTKHKMREGLCVDDISGGKEPFRICAINTINNERPPPFKYITKMIYPDWYRPSPPKGCNCVGGCTDNKCSCAIKNGGEIPYNHNGAIVEAKQLVYECGPHCRCPRSCYNRVTQHGMRIQLEIFKTESRGWGVRSLNSIASGSFICEYIGELLEDSEAEKRTSNDEYLFDIGQNYSDCRDDTASSITAAEDGGFTIDAALYGNVGRFINHSCSPNLYAQNVLYDHDDKRMPHIMLFAAENIPALKELTYHYNYQLDAVHDSNGNIKVKKCFCGSAGCTGRMY